MDKKEVLLNYCQTEESELRELMNKAFRTDTYANFKDEVEDATGKWSFEAYNNPFDLNDLGILKINDFPVCKLITNDENTIWEVSSLSAEFNKVTDLISKIITEIPDRADAVVVPVHNDEYCNDDTSTFYFGIYKDDIIDLNCGDTQFITPYGVFEVTTPSETQSSIAEGISTLIVKEGIHKTFPEEMWNDLNAYVDFENEHFAIEIAESGIRDWIETLGSMEGDSGYYSVQQEEIVKLLEKSGEISFTFDDMKEYGRLSYVEKNSPEKLEKYADLVKFNDEYEQNKSDYIDRYVEAEVESYKGNEFKFIINYATDEEINDYIMQGKIGFNFDALAKDIYENPEYSEHLNAFITDVNGKRVPETVKISDGENTLYISKISDQKIEKCIELSNKIAYDINATTSYEITSDDVMDKFNEGVINREDMEGYESDLKSVVLEALEIIDEQKDLD